VTGAANHYAVAHFGNSGGPRVTRRQRSSAGWDRRRDWPPWVPGGLPAAGGDRSDLLQWYRIWAEARPVPPA